MKRSFALIVFVALAASCRLQHPITQAEVLTILSDARAGISVGCDAEWLDAAACTQVYRVFDDAAAAVQASASGGWAAVAKAVIVTEEARLPADSKLRPYLDAVTILLG